MQLVGDGFAVVCSYLRRPLTQVRHRRHRPRPRLRRPPQYPYHLLSLLLVLQAALSR
jgi:hypothetical protein